MKTRASTAILMTAALLATGSATAQQYSYSYDAHRYGGISTITSIDGRGGISKGTIIHGPRGRVVAITHPNGGLTTGTVDQFGNWYTITTPGNTYNDPRSIR